VVFSLHGCILMLVNMTLQRGKYTAIKCTDVVKVILAKLLLILKMFLKADILISFTAYAKSIILMCVCITL